MNPHPKQHLVNLLSGKRYEVCLNNRNNKGPLKYIGKILMHSYYKTLKNGNNIKVLIEVY